MRLQEEPSHALHVFSPRLNTLGGFPKDYLSKLEKIGLTTVSEVIFIRPEALRSRTGLSLEIINDIYDQLSSICSPSPQTILSINNATRGSFISLGSKSLDRLFGDGLTEPRGIPVGMLTEIVGESTTGKSCLSIQLSLNVQLPFKLGGLEGGCLYLSTESMFPTGRLEQMASLLVRKLNGDKQAEMLSETKVEFKMQDMMKNVHLSRVHDPETLLHTLHYSLPSFIDRIDHSDHLPIRLIVLDSIGAIFRTEAKESKKRKTERASELNQVADALKQLAHRFKLAVLIINQVSDVFIDQFPKILSPSSSTTSSSNSSLNNSSLPTTKINEQSSKGLPDINYEQQAIHFSGQRATKNRKEASLGLSWTNTINSRIMLNLLSDTIDINLDDAENKSIDRKGSVRSSSLGVVRLTPIRMREARIIFCPFGVTPLNRNGLGIKYIINEQGIVAINE